MALRRGIEVYKILLQDFGGQFRGAEGLKELYRKEPIVSEGSSWF